MSFVFMPARRCDAMSKSVHVTSQVNIHLALLC